MPDRDETMDELRGALELLAQAVAAKTPPPLLRHPVTGTDRRVLALIARVFGRVGAPGRRPVLSADPNAALDVVLLKLGLGFGGAFKGFTGNFTMSLRRRIESCGSGEIIAHPYMFVLDVADGFVTIRIDVLRNGVSLFTPDAVDEVIDGAQFGEIARAVLDEKPARSVHVGARVPSEEVNARQMPSSALDPELLRYLERLAMDARHLGRRYPDKFEMLVQSMYVSLSGARATAPDFDDEHGSRKKRLPNVAVVEWDEIRLRLSRAIILARPGAGKTWLLRLEALRRVDGLLNATSEPEGGEPLLVPVLITARELGKFLATDVGADAVVGILDAVKDRYSASQQLLGLLRDRILNGTAILLIDGLDLVPLARRGVVEESLRLLARDTRASILLTCRAEAYGEPPFASVGCPGELLLVPFGPEQVTRFIQRWCGADSDLRNALLRAIDRDPRLADLVRTPICLLFVCSMPVERFATHLSTRAALYEAALIEYLAGAWRPNERDTQLLRDHRATLKLHLLEDLAWEMAHAASGWSSTMSYTAVDSFVSAHARGRELQRDAAPETPSLIWELTEADGVLIRTDPLEIVSATASYEFFHPSIQEFLVARRMARCAAEEWRRWVMERRWMGGQWEEVITFVVQLVDKPAELIRELTDEREDAFHDSILLAGRGLAEVPDRVPSDLRDRLVQSLLALLEIPNRDFIDSRVEEVLLRLGGIAAPALLRWRATVTCEHQMGLYRVDTILCRISDASLFDYYVRQLDGSHEGAAANALARLGDSRAIPLLAASIRQRWLPNYGALAAIRSIGGVSGAEHLCLIAGSNVSEACASEAIQQLAAFDVLSAGIDPLVTTLVSCVRDALRAHSPEQVTFALRRIPSHKEAHDLLGLTQHVMDVVEWLRSGDLTLLVRIVRGLVPSSPREEELAGELLGLRAAWELLEREIVPHLYFDREEQVGTSRVIRRGVLVALSRSEAPEVVPILAKPFLDGGEDLWARSVAAQGIARIGGDEASVLLLRGLDSGNLSFASITAMALTEASSTLSMLDALRERLSREGTREEVEVTRHAAAAAMRYLGNENVVPDLCGVLDDPLYRVRSSAAAALGRIGDRRAVPALLAALPVLGDEGLEALRLLDGSINPTANLKLVHGTLREEWRRYRSVNRLPDLPGAEVSLPFLGRCLRADTQSIRQSAAAALIAAGTSEAFQVLVDTYAYGKSDNNELLDAIRRYRRPDAVDIVIRRVGDEQVNGVRAVILLRTIGDYDLSPHVVPLIDVLYRVALRTSVSVFFNGATVLARHATAWSAVRLAEAVVVHATSASDSHLRVLHRLAAEVHRTVGTAWPLWQRLFAALTREIPRVGRSAVGKFEEQRLMSALVENIMGPNFGRRALVSSVSASGATGVPTAE